MSALPAILGLLMCACNVYNPSLIVDDATAPPTDGAMEACATCMGSTGCIDVLTDKNNCGVCGHSCETGCTDGLCTPTPLANMLGSPHGILLNGSSLFVANHGSINVQVMSKIDGTGLKNFASSQLLPDRLATDGTTLFWSNDSPSLGGVNQQVFNATMSFITAQNLPSPYGLAMSGANLFITTLGTTNGNTGCSTGAWVNAVLTCTPATAGCYVNPCSGTGNITTLATAPKGLAGIAADTKNVYWASPGAHEIDFCPQPLCSGGPKIFAQGLGTPFDLVSDGTHVYFTDRSAGLLYYCPVAGCAGAPTVLASGLSDPLLVAVDALDVFVTLYANGTPGAGSVIDCALPACAGGATTIAKNLKAPYGVTLDTDYVYWSEEGTAGNASTDGTISKLKR